MRPPPGARPVELGQDGPSTLTVRWSHGHAGRHDVRALRLACRCAQCEDEWTGERRLDDGSVPQDVHPLAIEPVGLYGLQVRWSDGHETGIYTFETLAARCACDECVGQGASR
jgi:DUF971 family protein